MKEVTKVASRWTAFNALFWGLAVAGTMFGVPWAGNVVIFLVWLGLVLSISAYTLPLDKLDELIKAYKDFPKWFHNLALIVDIALACVFVANGWWITAIALMVGSAFDCATKQKAGIV